MADKFDYISAAASASEVVEYFGSTAVITRQTTGTIDPATGETQAGATDILNGTITPILPVTIVSEGSVSKTVGQSYWVGALIKVGDYYLNNRVDSVEVIQSPAQQIIIQKLIFNG